MIKFNFEQNQNNSDGEIKKVNSVKISSQENNSESQDEVSIHIGLSENTLVEDKRESQSLYERLNNHMLAMTKVKSKELVTFFRLLATMINAGITILKALKILAKQTTNPRFQGVLLEFVERVENGEKLSACLKSYPDIFNEATVGMIDAGESSGQMNKVLLDISDQLEKSQGLKNKILSAMIYPIAVLVVMFLAGIAMMVAVVPQFKDLFSQLGAELPTSTQTLINVSDFCVNYWMYMILTIFLLVFLLKQYKKTEVGAKNIDNLMLRLPIFGDLSKKVCLTRFSSMLASLSTAGINVVQALEINANAIGNKIYQERILKIRDDVKEGIPIARNIENETFLFPEMVVNMIDVGEQTATVNKVASKIADFYNDEVDTTVKGLSTAMEPIIIVVIAVVVGGMAMAIMQPIFGLSEVIQNA